MKKPRRTQSITRGLLLIADAAEKHGPSALLGHRVRTNDDRHAWQAALRAIDWIRDLRVYDYAKTGEDPQGGCIGDT